MATPAPVLVDRSLLWALTILWAVFAAWGVAAFMSGIQSIALTAGTSYSTFATLGIALLSFALMPLPIIEKDWAEKLERWLTLAWVVLVVAIYSGSVAYQVITEHDVHRIHLLVVSFAYVVIPIWRFQFLTRRKYPYHNE